MANKKASKKTTKKIETKKVENAYVFTGDPNDDYNPTWIAMYGYNFKLNGAAVKIKDNDLAKIANNSHFTKA